MSSIFAERAGEHAIASEPTVSRLARHPAHGGTKGAGVSPAIAISV
jgi:hypothetical protein